jgi:hypothetical protein
MESNTSHGRPVNPGRTVAPKSTQICCRQAAEDGEEAPEAYNAQFRTEGVIVTFERSGTGGRIITIDDRRSPAEQVLA